jgi:hypothetical protein
MDEPDLRSRWRGQAGRLEVWYATLTDAATGTGLWLHHELVAPSDGGTPWAHGWITVFEPGSRPLLRRFGPGPWASPGSGFSCGEVVYVGAASGSTLSGRAGDAAWQLTSTGSAPTLHTFPRWAWRRELLPAAQVVPRPTALFSGTVRLGDRTMSVRDAPGAEARIYGHGNARRWGWLHADLGDGEVCEVVAAVSMRPGLDRLPPLPFVRFRLAGGDWPGDPLLGALGLRSRLTRDGFEVRGRQLHIAVGLPEEETVEVDYADPDGATLLCRNSGRASATIELRHGRDVRSWTLDGTAHAEVGGFRSSGGG